MPILVDPYLARMAQAYNAAHDLGTIQHGHYAEINLTIDRLVASAYERMAVLPYHHPAIAARALSCYRVFESEVAAQWAHITAWGISLIPWDKTGQPYANSRQMVADVRNNRRLYFFTGGEPHPYLGVVDPATGLSANDRFRAVHDIFGHAVNGYQFGARGEFNAWLAHSQMFTPEAQRALTTETRGQTCWVNNYADHADIPVADRPYAVQKYGILDPYYSHWKPFLLSDHDRLANGYVGTC